MINTARLRKLGELGQGVLRYNILAKFQTLLPVSLMINLTYKCNSKCLMCNIWKLKPKKELGIKDWQELIKDSIFREIKNLTVSGGEAFLYKDYVGVIELFIESMPKLQRLVLNTNGFLTRKIVENIKEISTFCKKKNIKLIVSVSVDGVGGVHNNIRGIKNGFEKVEETIDKLKKISRKNGFNVEAASLLLSKNINNFYQTNEWLKRKGIGYGFQIVGFHDVFVSNMESEKELGFENNSKKKIIEIMRFLKNNKNKFGINNYYWADMINMYENGRERTTPCPFLKDDFVIDSLGDVYYCLSVKPIGNFIKEKRSVGKIYFDKKNVEFRKQLPFKDCKRCNSGCDVTRALVYDLKRLILFKLTGKLWNRRID